MGMPWQDHRDRLLYLYTTEFPALQLLGFVLQHFTSIAGYFDSNPFFMHLITITTIKCAT